MEKTTFCQSCSMPIDSLELLGTEKDGALNHEYCKYCYQNGAFVNPEMSLRQMTTLVIEQMEKRNIDQKIIDIAVSNLPNLKRWNSKVVPS